MTCEPSSCRAAKSATVIEAENILDTFAFDDESVEEAPSGTIFL